jgi:hypothetical protein
MSWKPDPPDLSLLQLGLQMYTTVPSYELRWGLANFLSGMASYYPITASRVTKITGMRH